MYSRRERPLTLAERQRLRDRLRDLADEMFGNLGFCLGVCVIDLLMLASAIAIYTEQKSINFCGSGCWGLCLLAFNAWLCGAALNFLAGILERRSIRQALRDGVAIVERVSARRALNIRWAPDHEWRVLLAVGDDTVLVMPSSAIPVRYSDVQPDPKAGSLVPAFFERVTTRPHSIPLGTTTLGRAGTPNSAALDLNKVIADPQSRRRIIARLSAQAALLLRGNLSSLPELLEGEAIEGEVTGNLWDELQAQLEAQFGQDFGPGGLARLQPGNVNDLVELLMRRLPAGASTRVHPARREFYWLRTALSEELKLDRRRIHPHSTLETLIPRRRRRQIWQRLGVRLGRPLPGFASYPLPGCSITAWGVALLLCYLFGSPALLLFQSLALTHNVDRQPWFVWATRLAQGAVLLLTAGAVCLLGLLIWRQRRYCEFDPQRATVGQVARAMADAGQGVEVPWTEENIFLAVRRILAQIRGCRPMDISWTTQLQARE